MKGCLSTFVLFILSGLQVFGQEYYMARQGDNCFTTCAALGMNCNSHIATNNSAAIFTELGISCKHDPQLWSAQDQPCYVSDPSDANYGSCIGYIKVPQDVMCGGYSNTTSRLCRCKPVADATDTATFGLGISNGFATTDEFQVFGWTVAPGTVGVMDHFWITGPYELDWVNVIVRYYVDGETEPSIKFSPGMAAGVGFDDPQAPWGNDYVGKGAAEGAWYVNIRIPFQRNIRVTWQRLSGLATGMYIIVRGSPNLPISIGGIPIPSTAKLLLFNQNVILQPLEYFNVAYVDSGSGLLFFHTLSVDSDNLNFLEGCYRQYSPPNETYPGTLLSTGTEDYYDSAYYFNAGEFHLPNAGYTHYADSSSVTWSAYRFHVQDPLRFSKGFRLVWRNGDAIDPATGLKCYIETGGTSAGDPGKSSVVSYAWVYVW